MIRNCVFLFFLFLCDLSIVLSTQQTETLVDANTTDVSQFMELSSRILQILDIPTNGHFGSIDHRLSVYRYLHNLYKMIVVNETTGERSNIYDDREYDNDDEYDRNSQLLIGLYSKNFSVVKNQSNNQFNSDNVIWFDTKHLPSRSEILYSRLHLFYNTSNHSSIVGRPKTVKTVIISQITPGDNSTYKLVECGRKVIEDDCFGWLHFNVTFAVQFWHTFADYNFGLHVAVEDGAGRSTAQQLLAQPLFSDQRPETHTYLIVSLRPETTLSVSEADITGGRRKRSLRLSDLYAKHSAKYEDTGLSACRRHNHYVSFKDLKWDKWIIAPPGYSAYYCAGFCEFPLNSKMNATNHALIQTIANLFNPDLYPTPQCAPSRLDSISVLYLDKDSNIVLRSYSNMVAASCGCM